jgi:hypothetical protein
VSTVPSAVRRQVSHWSQPALWLHTAHLTRGISGRVLVLNERRAFQPHDGVAVGADEVRRQEGPPGVSAHACQPVPFRGRRSAARRPSFQSQRTSTWLSVSHSRYARANPASLRRSSSIVMYADPPRTPRARPRCASARAQRVKAASAVASASCPHGSSTS